jgi:hypothetical protein
MIDDDVLIGRVAESLRAHARAVTIRERPFDPTQRMAEVVEIAATREPGRAGRIRRMRPRATVRFAVAAAALLAVVGVGVAQFAIGSGDGDDGAPELVALVPPQVPAPSDGLAATWLPDGWRVAHVDWSTPAGTTSNYGPLRPIEWETYGDRAQLFADGARRGAALLVESGDRVVSQGGSGEPVTVRGHQGRLVHSTDRSDLAGPTGGDVMLITWTEGDTDLRASFTGLGIDQALAALDGLVARPGGPAAGFDAPRGGGLAQVGEAQMPDESTDELATVVSVAFEAPGSERRDVRLTVQTVSPAGRTTVPYLVASLYGVRDADGIATFWDATAGTRTIVHPDGQAVRVAAFTLDETDTVVPAGQVPGVGSAGEVTARVAASVEPVTSERLSGWWDEVNTRRMRLPLRARVELPTATIEVRSEGDTQALCDATAAGAEAETVCALVIPDRGNGGTLWTTLHIGGEDYEVAASSDGQPQFLAHGEDGTYAIDAETGGDGGWHVALARPVRDPFEVVVR